MALKKPADIIALGEEEDLTPDFDISNLAGLIKSKLTKEEDKKNLIISGSYLLFPFARSIITNVTMEGGLKPLIIQPIQFENMFKQ